MGSFVIEGGHRLSGQVRISGAKNAILPILAAALLCPEECLIHEVPELRDVTVMLDILRYLGVEVETRTSEGGRRRSISTKAGQFRTHIGPSDLMGQMRSSIFVMGPLLGRLGRVTVTYPGGCAIGPRPIDLHLRGLSALGARFRERYGRIEAEAPNLTGNEVHLDFPSVGATENIMMAAVLAEGTTIIRNTAREPEIVDLQNFLNSMGAQVRGAGSDSIRIDGVRRLHGAEHSVIPDRIEAGTMLAAVAATGGCVELANIVEDHIESAVAKLREAGLLIREGRDTLEARASGRLRSVDFKTLPYPGFPTDLQPQAMALMSVTEGTSLITETVFDKRFNHVEELTRMGARIRVEGRAAVVEGVDSLSGTEVTVPDLRGGAALVIAGLAAEGVSKVKGTDHIDRGYDGFEVKLTGLGAIIRREP
ncbi:MAG TPA: UDP-N-acetylglucosamine 1-carboxyvinyltransferase [Bacillota bacterium]